MLSQFTAGETKPAVKRLCNLKKVILSPGISVGVENYCTKMSGEESTSKMPSFDEGLRYYHKGFKHRCVSTTLLAVMRYLSPASQVTSIIMSCLAKAPLETILGRPLFFSWFISFNKHLLNINHGPGTVLGTLR